MPIEIIWHNCHAGLVPPIEIRVLLAMRFAGKISTGIGIVGPCSFFWLVEGGEAYPPGDPRILAWAELPTFEPGDGGMK